MNPPEFVPGEIYSREEHGKRQYFLSGLLDTHHHTYHTLTPMGGDNKLRIVNPTEDGNPDLDKIYYTVSRLEDFKLEVATVYFGEHPCQNPDQSV